MNAKRRVTLLLGDEKDIDLVKLFPDTVEVDVHYACSRTLATFGPMDAWGREKVAWLAQYLTHHPEVCEA